jgi:hypothetical protein
VETRAGVVGDSQRQTLLHGELKARKRETKPTDHTYTHTHTSIIELTRSPPFFRNARTAFALETDACPMTSSMSLGSMPSSSTSCNDNDTPRQSSITAPPLTHLFVLVLGWCGGHSLGYRGHDIGGRHDATSGHARLGRGACGAVLGGGLALKEKEE